MELRQLEYFVAVAEERHFTRAAARLHIAQSGLSAAVRTLERELGAELFARTTRRVELTDAGRALLGEARRTLASAEAAREAVAAVTGLLSGTLTVGAEQCMGTLDPVSLLADFRTRHPGVAVQLEQAGTGRLAAEVRAGRMDVAFVASDAATGTQLDGLALHPLAESPMVLLCRPDHPLAAAERPVPCERLAGGVFVDLHPDWGSRRVAEAAFAAAGVPRRVAMEVNDVHALVVLVGRGLGAAVVPRPVADKEVARELGLRAVPLEGAPVWRVSVATAAPRTAGSAAGRALLAAIRERLLPVSAHSDLRRSGAVA
ncbi:hypothetical protein BIV57_12300 [Mangrovactinospora gilvigrisea]|uniref:HTH lysR-type domain-containing protein n=1 Tax=Mangrovactinospora gilvigrisea TaxID=1428644 RepID=A0A1J7C6L4_9ACTN|nr:LysR family transcriptional regulator [Mangrovactinospora gilvigrisea]OIV37208.1 hypothetical protein BIV57_12300 [Mangrovactinospora gilvigrisea]